MRLVPPPRDLSAESREALRRYRESVDFEDEPTQPEIHVHLGDLARAREVARGAAPASDPPLRKRVGALIVATTAAVAAIGALAEAIRQVIPLLLH